MKDFFNLYQHGFARVAVATPLVRVGDPQHNAEATLELIERAAAQSAVLVAFPGARPLGLHLRRPVPPARAARRRRGSARARCIERTRQLPIAALVGLPLRSNGLLFNCAALVCRGRLLGVVPKTYLPNYREFYEARQFTPGDTAACAEIELAGQPTRRSAPNCIFQVAEQPRLRPARRDLRGPVGADPAVVLRRARRRDGARQPLGVEHHRSARPSYRHQLVGNQSARCLAAYLYCAAGLGRIDHRPRLGRPGADLRERHAARRVEALRRRAAAHHAPTSTSARLAAERMRQNTFGDAALRHHERRARASARVAVLACRCRARHAARSQRESSASPTCPATRRRATSAARRCTTSRCKGSPRACAPRAARSS